MDKNIRLLMPTTEAISLTGINEGNIETFKNTPMLSLTKEELQNSCDGRNKGNEDPVVVEFNDFYMSPSDLPDYDNLLKIFIEERDFWDKFSKEDKKAVELLVFPPKLCYNIKKAKRGVARVYKYRKNGQSESGANQSDYARFFGRRRIFVVCARTVGLFG